jgi:hypothetical protein
VLRIARAELDEKFLSRLVRLRLQALQHLCPVCPKGIEAATTRLVVEVAPLDVVDYQPAGTSVLAPDLHTFGQGFQLPRIKSAGELRAEFLEQL